MPDLTVCDLNHAISVFIKVRCGALLFMVIHVIYKYNCFGSLVILDVARCYLCLFTLYINIKIGKNSC